MELFFFAMLMAAVHMLRRELPFLNEMLEEHLRDQVCGPRSSDSGDVPVEERAREGVDRPNRPLRAGCSATGCAREHCRTAPGQRRPVSGWLELPAPPVMHQSRY